MPTALDIYLAATDASHTAHRKAVGAVDQAFAAFVDQADIVHNVGWRRLRDLLAAGRLRSTFRYREADCPPGTAPRDHYIATQPAFGARRLAFEDLFAEGGDLVYCLLSVTGFGSNYYGLFCAALDPAKATKLACVPEDSVTRYVDAAAVVDEPAVKSEIGGWVHRASVTLLRAAPADPDTTGWPDQLLRAPQTIKATGDYTEILWVGDVALTDLAFRMRRADLLGLLAIEPLAVAGGAAAALRNLEAMNALTSALTAVGRTMEVI